MPIDINLINNLQARTAEKPAQEVADKNNQVDRSQREVRESSNRDTVQLTDRAQNLQKLAQEVSKLPVVDADRVDSIKRMIEEGRFEINAERVASKILALESNEGRAEHDNQESREKE